MIKKYNDDDVGECCYMELVWRDVDWWRNFTSPVLLKSFLKNGKRKGKILPKLKRSPGKAHADTKT